MDFKFWQERFGTGWTAQSGMLVHLRKKDTTMTTTATELIDILIEDNGLNEYRLADKVGTNVHWIKEWRKKGFSSFQSAKRFLNAFGYELSKNWEITRDRYFTGDSHSLWIPEKTVLVTDW